MNFLPWIIKIPAILIAITIHEYAHARAAKAFGDYSAVLLGRASLNPLRHLDPIGTICLFLFNFGWARPVPINPYNFKNKRLGLFFVSFAGPFTNLLFALGIGLLFRSVVSRPGALSQLLFYLMFLNIGLGLFNLIPLPPLDGFHIVEALFERSKVIDLLNSIGPLALISIILLDNFAQTGIIGTILTKPMIRLAFLFGGPNIVFAFR